MNGTRTDVLLPFYPAADVPPASRVITNVSAVHARWGGWGSNPRPADYEKYGPTLPTLYLHGYHRVVTSMAFIALYALVARSTNRSTTHHSERLTSTTERHHAPRGIRRYAW